MTLPERILYIRKNADLTQAEFGKRIGIAQTTIGAYETGRREPIESTLKVICSEFNINMDWLKNGNGQPYNQADDELSVLIGNMLKGENETARAVFKAFAKLDDSEWKALQKLIDELKKQ